MFGLFQWVRSRTAAIVGLVVPISFEICVSDSSGWLLQQKGDRVRLVLALGDRRIARALVPEHLLRYRLRREFQPRLRIGLTARDLLHGGLTVRHRVETLHLVGDLAVRDRLDLERMQLTEIGNLLEGERRYFRPATRRSPWASTVQACKDPGFCGRRRAERGGTPENSKKLNII